MAQSGIRMKHSPHVEMTQGKCLLEPVLEGLLGEAYDRTEGYKRFQEKRPMVAIIGGSIDHPATINDQNMLFMVAKAIWDNGGLPFALTVPVVCDGVMQGHLGMSYSLISRNRTSADIIGQMEGHGYHAAVVLQSCDKQPTAVLGALCELDLLRQRQKKDPVVATFIPARVMRPGDLPSGVRVELEGIIKKLESGHQALAEGLRGVMREPLTCALSAGYQKMFQELVNHGIVSSEKRDELEMKIYSQTCPVGGMCAFFGTANSSRILTAGWGVVPKGLELLTDWANETQIGYAVDELFENICTGLSVSTIVKENCNNAIRVWSSTGGSTNLALHIPYVLFSTGIDGNLDKVLERRGGKLPQYFKLDLPNNKSMWTLAEQHRDEQHSGIDSLMKVLAQGGYLAARDLDARTVSGTWRERIADAIPPDKNVAEDARIIHAKPLAPESGIHKIAGNLCRSSVVKITGLKGEQLDDFDDKVFITLYYLGEDEVTKALQNTAGVLNGLKNHPRITKSDLLRCYEHNFKPSPDELKPMLKSDKTQIWDYLVEKDYLRLMVVVAGQGPRANGMPEMFTFTEYINVDPVLAKCCTTFTDGRISGATYGSVVVHAEPEAIDAGPILELETSDLIHLQLRAKSINVIDKDVFRQDGTIKPWTEEMFQQRHKGLGEVRLNQLIEKRNGFDSHLSKDLVALTGAYTGGTHEVLVKRV